MHHLQILNSKAVPCLVALVSCALFSLAPKALADSFSAAARVDVESSPFSIVCTTGLQGGGGSAFAILTDDCPLGGGGMAFISMGSGGASVSATGPDAPGYSTFAGASFYDPGAISGNGSLTLSGSVSGFGGVLNVDLISGGFDVGGACVDLPSGGLGCNSPSSFSIKIPVTDGMPLAISVSIDCGAVSGNDCTMSDPLTLTTSPGVTFNSSFPGFLSGSPPPVTPEPSSALLLAIGIATTALLAKHGQNCSSKQIAT